MTLKRTGNTAVIGKLNMAAIWEKWYNNFLSENWQGKRQLSIMENCMSNNVVAILNSDMVAIWWQFPDSKHFPRCKESLFSFQSAIISEIQSNVKHFAAILKSNMAASWRKFWHCQNVPRHRKHRYRHLNCGPRCNRTGYIGKTMVILAPYLKSNMAATRGANFGGLFFLMISMYHRTLVPSFMLS